MIDEKQFIKLLQEGNENAYRELINTYKNKIFKTALGFVPFADVAEDLTQEVFIEVFRSINSFRGDSKLSSWLYRITINKSINYINKNKKHLQSKTIDEYAEYSIFSDLQTDKDEALKIIYQKEQRKIINEALSKLPERQRICFSLNKTEGLSYKEISEIMQISVSSVESLIHRAKNGMQKLLINYYNEKNKT